MFALIVSIHDVAPSTAGATRTWTDCLDARDVPATLLVIPGPWEGPPLRQDERLIAWLHERVERGDEIAQHGWTHRRVLGGPRWRRAVSSVVARGAAEFAALDVAEATRRLSWGRRALANAGFDAVGFTPPGWLASPGTRVALEALGYRYVTSHTTVTDLVEQRGVRSVAVSHRPGGASERLGASVFRAVARHRARTGQSLRLALHPSDLGNPSLLRTTVEAIDVALDSGAVPTTYQHFLDTTRAA